jgi:putative ABC transport system permease protein
MLDFGLALRNLFRHKMRSLISLGAIIFGEIALLLSGGFIDWNLYGMRSATTYSLLGHVQIARPRFFTEGMADPSAFLLPDDGNWLGRIQSISEIKMVMSRLTFAGIVSHGETTVSFVGEGVDPDKEQEKERLAPAGEINKFITVSQGKGLSADDPKGVILGDGLASSLGVNLADKIVLLVTTPSGGVNAVEVNVRGLFFTLSKAYNDVALRAPIQLTQDLLRTKGSHVWMVFVDKTENTDRVVSELQRAAPPGNAVLEFKPWYQLADFYNKTARLYTSQMAVLYGIIGLIVVLSIANIMTMNVLERTGEIGTLMAIGTRRSKIMLSFVHEGMALGLVGGVVGIGLGWILARVISSVGIPMPPAPGMSHGFVAEIMIGNHLALTSLLATFVSVVVASLYPAWKASRLNIVDALRHNR